MTAARGATGDAAVKARTGRDWPAWFKLLDDAGVKAATHKDIVAAVARTGTDGWWAQQVATEYERARGLRAMNQKLDGFSVGISKTVGVALPALYAAAATVRARKPWFPDLAFAESSKTPEKYLRGVLGDGPERAEIYFYAKGAAKALVTVQINKLKDAKAVERHRALWRDALDRLKARLEKA